jgi:hypothetical protein
MAKLKMASQKRKNPTDPADGKSEERRYTHVTVQEMQQAERKIIKLIQAQAFSKEVKALTAPEVQVSSSSPLYNLDPFMDDDRLLRVGGRVGRSSQISQALKHPVVLPKDSCISNLIIAYHHRLVGHAGRGSTLNSIRNAGFWILRARAAVARYIMNCVGCRKLRGTACKQQMADLTQDRVEPAPPFTYSGVDFFGPFNIISGRTTRKRWGALFTCLSSHAIHLEVSYSLDADSFLNAYRRFVCRRMKTCIAVADGEAYNSLPTSFGVNGDLNFSHLFKNERNGTNNPETW